MYSGVKFLKHDLDNFVTFATIFQLNLFVYLFIFIVFVAFQPIASFMSDFRQY